MHTDYGQRRIFTALIFIVLPVILTSCGGGGTGTITPPPISSKVWGTAGAVETDDTGDAGSPQVAMDDAGKAIAVWRQYDGSQFSIYANYFDGKEWDSAELIETSTTGNANYPQIAMNGDGKAMVVWEYRVSGHTSIMTNNFDGSEWGIPQNVGNDDADSPQIAMNEDGEAFGVWRQYNNFLYDISAGSFDGTSWDTAKLIDYDNNGSAYSPQIAMDDAGNAVAVWKQYDGFRYNIWANHFDASLTSPKWGTAERIESERGSADAPQVAMNNDGKAIAVWAQDDGSNFSIYSSRFDGASWDTATRIGWRDHAPRGRKRRAPRAPSRRAVQSAR